MTTSSSSKTSPEGYDYAERDEMLRQLWKGTPAEYVAQLPRGGAMLDYLGHADTCRLIADVDPLWQWEPSPEFAALWGESGAVVRDQSGYPVRLFIKLTILGVTRPGIGSVLPGKSDPEKELIGDAIRNAAQRFGVGADLWSKAKGKLDDTEGAYHRGQQSDPPPDPATWFERNGWKDQAEHDGWRKSRTGALKADAEGDPEAFDEVQAWMNENGLDKEAWKRAIPKPAADALDAFMLNRSEPEATSPADAPQRAEEGAQAVYLADDGTRMCGTCQTSITSTGGCECKF